MSKTLLLYTREPMDSSIYDPKLANSMHIAIKTDSGYKALNHNSGVFFAKAASNDDGSITAKNLRDPVAFKLSGSGYGIAAVRCEPDGSCDRESVGCVLIAITYDFLHYREIGLLKVCDEEIKRVAVKYCENGKAYKVAYRTDSGDGVFRMTDVETLTGASMAGCKNTSGCCLESSVVDDLDIEGAHPSCEIEVSDEIGEKLVKKLITPENISIDVPGEIEAASAQELANVMATAHYSDGSVDNKRIDWELDNVDFSRPGRYEIKGKVHQDHFDFPITLNRADPCIGRWNGKYYFIATDDSSHETHMYIRCADTIPELCNAPETLILDAMTYPDIGGLLWAPEFHIINNRLYIFHAATPGEFFREESHIMALREGGDPMNRDDWSRPQRIVKADGSELCEAGKVITLDMTTFNWEGKDYAIWSQRQFLPKDLGAWLMIALLDSDDPHKLASEPIVLSKPDYGWANNHTFVDEGPFALIRDDKLWVSFSSAAVDSTYVVAFLSIEKGKDPLNVNNWVKANYPALTSRSVDGIFGPGHNAYVTDNDGKVWNTFHGRPGVNGPRSAGIRRVHFDIYGEPVLDMTEELDIKPELRDVKTTLIIK